jgi:hypothetical protein
MLLFFYNDNIFNFTFQNRILFDTFIKIKHWILYYQIRKIDGYVLIAYIYTKRYKVMKYNKYILYNSQKNI